MQEAVTDQIAMQRPLHGPWDLQVSFNSRVQDIIARPWKSVQRMRSHPVAIIALAFRNWLIGAEPPAAACVGIIVAVVTWYVFAKIENRVAFGIIPHCHGS